MKSRLLLAAASILLLGSIPREDTGAICQPDLEGTWILVSYANGGNPHPFTGYTWTFRKGKMQVHLNGQLAGTHNYSLDTSANPPRIIWVSKHGIYEINGDAMRMCFDMSGKSTWPDRFVSSDNQYLYALKRPNR